MTPYQVTLDPQTLQRLFSGDSQLGQLLEAVLNQVLEAQVREQLQAAPYERTEQRQGYRNGYQPRRLTTRVGRLVLRVPQVCEGLFSTELFARYRRESGRPSSSRSWRWWSMAPPPGRWRASRRSCAAPASPGRPSPTCAQAWIPWCRPGTNAS